MHLTRLIPRLTAAEAIQRSPRLSTTGQAVAAGLSLSLVITTAATGSAAEATGASGSAGISGRVSYVGNVPLPYFVMEGGGRQDVLAVNPTDRGLRFAVVSLEASRQAPAAPLPALTMDQLGWMFQPPVLALRDGQSVTFTNSDGSNHNVRSGDPEPANRFSAYTSALQPYRHRFRAKADHSPVVVTCETHPWMIAWVYVFDHPHFSLTDASGRFQIHELPPGPYRLAVRHAAGGLQRSLELKAGAGQSLEIVFTAADLRPAAPSGR